MASDAIQFFIKFNQHELYPAKREFTEFEAWMDLLVRSYPKEDITDSLGQLSVVWGWNKSRVNRFLERLAAMSPPLLIRNQTGSWEISKADRWYGKPSQQEEWGRKQSQLVVDLYNKIFNRKCQLNEYRQRTITARIKEGVKSTPPIGIAQFEAVFLLKKQEWENDEKYSKYLIIETLCARKHFQKYLDQARQAHKATTAGVGLKGSIMTVR